MTGVVPFLTEVDPEQAGEGSLDPLGLAPIADRLADTIAPGVTARMLRIRFVTAIAVGAVVTESLGDLIAADGVSPAYLAYEWLLVEAMARCLPPSAAFGVPGINKARSVVARGAHLDARSYLKVPKVFGFHGVYKRLARDVNVVDDHLVLEQAGDRLVRLWEKEQELPGFADRKSGTRGGRFAANIETAIRAAATQSGIATSASSHLWSKLVRPLAPAGALPQERDLLFELLTDPDQPIRREFTLGVHRLSAGGSEADVLRALRPDASATFAARLHAIDAYERVAELLTSSLNTMRRVSTGRGTSPVSPAELSANPVLAQAADELSTALVDAFERLNAVGDVVAQADVVFAPFEGVVDVGGLVEALLARHEDVQDLKGKRPWFERTPRGFVVRPLFRTGEDPTIQRQYVHPYRVTAVRSFIGDLVG